jgi:hypothetical protein
MFQLEEDYLEITMKNSQQYTSCASFLDENETANNSHVVRAQHQQHHPLQSPFSISRSCSFFSSSIQSFAQVDHQANLGDNTIYPYQYQFTEILDTSMDHTFHQKKTSQPIFHNTESNSIITNIPTVSSIAALSSTVAATANNYDPSTSSTTTTLCKIIIHYI